MKKIIPIFLLLIFLLTGCSGNKTDYNEEKLSKMNAYTEQNAACVANQVVIIGDSIAELWADDASFKTLADTLGKEVYGRGISGDTSDKLLERIESNVVPLQPSKIILLIGTNDIAYKLTDEDTVNNVTAILQKLKADCPDSEIYLQAVYHTNDSVIPEGEKKNTMVGPRSNEHIDTLNALLSDVAAKENVSFIDLNTILTDDDGKLRAEYTYDGLHPTDEGFAVITEAILNTVNA